MEKNVTFIIEICTENTYFLSLASLGEPQYISMDILDEDIVMTTHNIFIPSDPLCRTIDHKIMTTADPNTAELVPQFS